MLLSLTWTGDWLILFATSRLMSLQEMLRPVNWYRESCGLDIAADSHIKHYAHESGLLLSLGLVLWWEEP